MMKRIALLLVLALAAPLHAAYHVVRHIQIGGAGGWDYIYADAAGRRLYVSHFDHVVVINLNDHKIIGTIPKTEGVHGIAIAPELHRGFISNGRSSTVTIFDTENLKTIAEVKATGENPDSILYDPATKHVYTFNGRGHNATVYDTDGKVLATIPLDAKPEEAKSDLAGHIFVNLEDKSEIAVLDANKSTIEHVWPIAPCEEPSGLAIDRAHHRLFAGCGNQKMVVVDDESGKVLTAVQVGRGVDGTTFDEEKQLAFVPNGFDGTVTVIREVSPSEFDIAETVPTARGARTITLDEKTHAIYLPTAKFGPAPAATPEHPRPRPTIVPDTFEVIEVAP